MFIDFYVLICCMHVRVRVYIYSSIGLQQQIAANELSYVMNW